MTPLYYECHITLDTVPPEKYQHYDDLSRLQSFAVASLTQRKSTKDITTGRSQSIEDLRYRANYLKTLYTAVGLTVKRIKIEAAIYDESYI